MYVTPYRISWIIVTLDFKLVISYIEKLLIFRWVHIVLLLYPIFFLFYYERDFLTSLSDDNQVDIIETFKSK